MNDPILICSVPNISNPKLTFNQWTVNRQHLALRPLKPQAQISGIRLLACHSRTALTALRRTTAEKENDLEWNVAGRRRRRRVLRCDFLWVSSIPISLVIVRRRYHPLLDATSFRDDYPSQQPTGESITVVLFFFFMPNLRHETAVLSIESLWANCYEFLVCFGSIRLRMSTSWYISAGIGGGGGDPLKTIVVDCIFSFLRLLRRLAFDERSVQSDIKR